MGPLYCLYECMYVSVRKSEEEVGQLRKNEEGRKGRAQRTAIERWQTAGAVAGKEEEKKEEKKKEEEK